MNEKPPLPPAPTRDLFDYKHGSLVGRPGVLRSKASPLRVSSPLTGDVQTFIIESFRERDEAAGPKDRVAAKHHVFIEYTDRDKHVRMYVPPEVADCIARQRDALNARQKSKSARAAVEQRKAAGEVFGFAKKKQGGTKKKGR